MTGWLLALSGLPGTGKTTLARALSEATGAVHLRIDSIEAALSSRGVSFEGARGDTGYVVAYALARDVLMRAQSAIVDGVHGWPEARALQDAAIAGTGARLFTVELACSDTATHRDRIESRISDLPGLTLPTWDAVRTRDVTSVPAPDLTLDTARCTIEQAVDRLQSVCAPL
ncbi:AAA family ATPase [Maritimibacter sp. UBA3975]|uniref:AAA family ATPase n=1 Tax=Maritimibacter sp. UBA3975 TaxID=1946833 RepID=UPI0025BE78F6|nr:AAA family ATPase [Maritimibacter sp. UBA3975]